MPATQKSRSPKGRWGVHQTPWQCTLSHACHAKEAEPQGTPGRTSDPLAMHIVPTPAHAKEAEPQGTPGRTSNPLAVQIVPTSATQKAAEPQGDARAYIQPLGSADCPTPATQKAAEPQGDARAYTQPLGSADCPTPATQKRRSPKGRQGVHPTPGLPRKRGGAPRDARAYIQPLGSTHCPTPATQKRRSPKGRQGVHQTPWHCTLSHACHAKAAEPQGTPGRTSDPLAVHPLAVHIVARPATQKEAEPQGTPGRTSDPLALHIVPRLPRKSGGAPRDARAYIPLAVQIVPRLPRKRGGAPRDARAYIQPLGSADCPTPATQKRRSPKGRQGVHPTPWQCTLSHACHAKEAEPQGTPGRTSNPLAVQTVPRLPRKSGGAPRGRQGVHPTPWQYTLSPRLPRKRGGAPRDARAYIRPLGTAHCPTPATQKRRSPKGRQGVHQTPWQCTLSHACHTKEAEPQGTPGRTSDPLAVHIVPRLPRKSGGAPRDARAYIQPLGSADCPAPATQKRRSPKGRQGVHQTPWQCTLSHACHAKSGGAPRGRQGVHPTPWQCRLSHACHAKAAEPQGTPGRTSEPLAVHIVPRLPRKMHMSERVCEYVSV